MAGEVLSLSPGDPRHGLRVAGADLPDSLGLAHELGRK